MVKFYTFCLLLTSSVFSFAQPTVYDLNKLRPDSLAAMIMGNQATVSNAQIICPNDGGGLFWGASGLDFSNGMLLTTGTTQIAFSPNNTGSATGPGGPGYLPLEEFPWAYNGTFNACVLKFDFVPQVDTIEVAYVFGSEEYPEYVGSSFNDIFAIIIEGTPEYPEEMPITDRNIAQVFTGSEYVVCSIGSLNSGSNNQHYVDNTSLLSPGKQNIQYDGYSTGLTAKAKVSPSNTYSITFAVADVSDAIYDSGLFIGFNNEDINPFVSDYCRELEIAAYQDDNKNGVWDAEEPPLPSQKISIEPLQQIVTTGASGTSIVVVDTGTYVIRALESDTYTPIFQPEQTIVVEKDNELPILEFAYRRFVVEELNIHAFWDENENGVQDGDEIPLFRQLFELQPNSQQLFTDEAGQVKVLLTEGEYVLSYQQNTLWELTTSDNYFIEIGEDTEQLPDYYFGIKPRRILPKGNVHLSSCPTRCNTTVKYFLNYTNSGTTIAEGTVTLAIDELMDLVSANPEPDVMEEGKLIWHFSELLPSYENKIQLQFQMPDFNSMGEILETQATVQLFNENQEQPVYSKSTDYNSEVQCAYDPNDKLVQSNLLGQSEFAYLADTILYTVRFQNTGNDTAFDIRIEDKLDKKLDWTTFRPITASHDFHTTLDRTTGLVTFYFDDIMLPDSTTNEIESHGFVTFGIASLENLGDKIEVDNTASIFFDFNPPIITNTAAVTLLEQVEVVIIPRKILKIVAFWDKNGNNILDEGEVLLPNQPFLVMPKNKRIHTNSEGVATMPLFGGNYQISYPENPSWEMTIPNTYNATIQENTDLPTYYFGLQLKTPGDKLTNEILGINTSNQFFNDNQDSNTLIEQAKKSIQYSMFIRPNPFSDYTTIEVNGLSPQENYQLEVMNILGRKVRELKIEGGKVNLERGELETGLYLIRIIGEENGRILGSEKMLVE